MLVKRLTTIIALISFLSSITYAAVDLQWRPSAKIVHLGDMVDLGLYMVSDDGWDWPVGSMDVIINHTPSYLAYRSLIKVPGLWMSDDFFSGAPDNLNKSITDGQMMYTAWANLGESVLSTPAGICAVIMRFNAKALSPCTSVTIPAVYGTHAETIIYDGEVTNLDITGIRDTARVMIVPQNVVIVNSLPVLKQLADETPVALTGPVVTRSYGSFFYIEEMDRSSGIKVSSDTPVAEGTSPFVQGVLRTLNGERVVDNSTVGEGSIALVPGAFAMNTKMLSQGLNPTGLLVKLTGRVQDSSTASTLVISDGSGQDVMVELYGVSAPSPGSYVTLTGALGADINGPVLRVNNIRDLQVLQH